MTSLVFLPAMVRHLLRNTLSILPLCAVVLSVALQANAQQKSDFAGDYAGMVGPLHVKLHITMAPDGSVSAKVDSPDQYMVGVPCSDIVINGPTISLTVPTVRGEYMGTLSADHNSLSGIWKQGAPMPLNFTRSGVAASSAAAAPAAPAVVAPAAPASVATTATAAAPATSTGSMRPPCSTPGPNYWDGASWKPMVMAAHQGRDQGVSIKQGLKNPFNPRGGLTTIYELKNTAAALTLDAQPSFCVMFPATVDPTVIMIGSLDVKKDHRELETCTGPCASSAKRTSDDWMPQKHQQPVDVLRLSSTAVQITPKSPLNPGQYLIGGPGAVAGYYDFGVGAQSGSN
jgi:hypothetical protein